MLNRRNYYRILHVQPDAHCEIIKASYRTLMQKLKQHPDLGGDDWNASILNEAYRTLTNPKKRAAYDQQFLHRHKSADTQSRQQHADRKKQQKRQPTNTRRPKTDDTLCPFCRTPKPVRFRYNNSGECNSCRSPLKSVMRLALAGSSRRTMQRSSHHAPLGFYTDPENMVVKSGSISDLSPHGMQFSTTSQLDEGQVIKIVSDVLTAVAQVTYCREQAARQAYTVGVSFLTLHFYERSGTFISENA